MIHMSSMSKRERKRGKERSIRIKQRREREKCMSKIRLRRSTNLEDVGRDIDRNRPITTTKLKGTGAGCYKSQIGSSPFLPTS